MLSALFTSATAPLTTVRAWTCLGINLFATPGLGSVMGGRKVAGWGQLVFSIAGFCLIVGWMAKISFGNAMAEINGVEPAPIPAWWWQTGVVLFGIAWIWSFATSISLLLEAAREGGAGGAIMVPPKLAEVAKPAPPALVSGLKLKALDSYQISAALSTVPAWQRQGANIVRQFQFADFAAAMSFVNQVARLAEEAAHHPDIDIRWNRVTLALSTHDVGGLTDRDFALARQFDRLT